MNRFAAIGLGMWMVAQCGWAAETLLSELDLSGMQQGWGQPVVDAAVDGPPLRVAGEFFEHGIGTHAPAMWKLRLDGKASEFRARVGVQEYPDNPGVGSVEFIVRGDGQVLWRSGVMRGRDAAKTARAELKGVKELALEVTDAGDGNISDHADWLQPVLVHEGAPLPPVRESDAPAQGPANEPLLADAPGEPANAPATVEWDETSGLLRLRYDGGVLFEGQVRGGATVSNSVTRRRQAITQQVRLTGKNLALQGRVSGGEEVLAAETSGPAQRQFPLVRTSNGGPSRNLRNNAVYDRGRDWMLAGPAGATRLESESAPQFKLICQGDTIELVFRPRYYQRHKNLTYFRPWTYQVRKDSITGWSSWWAYMRNFNQHDLDALLAVWKEKRFADYGYRFIQIDDCYQGGEHARHKLAPNNGYPGGHPETWLEWRKELFPGGLAGYVAAVKQAGFEPAVWIGAHFGTMDIVEKHPDWFVQGADGKPFVGPWIGCAMDASNPQVAEALIRPTYRGLKNAGVSYVKIDILRHYLYDNLHHNLAYCSQRGLEPADVLRDYLRAAREELGPQAFILSCWGVLPESVGLADACRIGGDGYGPVTMQQYNSWNGIVWRNDPDHCDVYPKFKPAEAGNVSRTSSVAAAPADTILRPALASIAGCMLILSDKPAVYRDDANLEGLRRAAPVLFSVPGQLYDFDGSKTRNLIRLSRTSITSGANPSPIDADQFGPVCPWWLNEFDRPFEHWNVLHHLNWSDKPGGKTTVRFADLGLEADRSYLLYEFWSRKFLGSFRGQVELSALKPKGLESLAIREELGRPQLVSTSRHLSQGGVDLVAVDWSNNTLQGRSRVVAADRYELAVHVPSGYELVSAEFGASPAAVVQEGPLVRVAVTPEISGEVPWKIQFRPSAKPQSAAR
jgi:hypothetical protein